jgi:hypothetical protein
VGGSQEVGELRAIHDRCGIDGHATSIQRSSIRDWNTRKGLVKPG